MLRWLRALAAAADTQDRVARLTVPPANGEERLADEVRHLRAEMTKLLAEVADLRTSVVALSGGADDDDLVHTHLAEVYRNLVTQQFRELARLRWARIRGDRPATDGPVTQARLVRELVRLTVLGTADEHDLTAWLTDGSESNDLETRAVEGACGQARRLRTGMADTAKPAAFAEDVPRGRPLAAGAGKPWATCPPGGVAAFVVAPAYVLRGRTLTESLVFTLDA